MLPVARRRPAAEQEEPGQDRVALRSAGVVRRPDRASRERRARRATNGSFARCRPATRMPQAPTPKSTTRIIGSRKPEELVAVAEIESGRKATASTSPSEMIEKHDRLEPELDAGHPPQRCDLDDVVQPERQDHAARRGGATGRQAAGTAGTAGGGEELLPAERPEDVAREVEGDGGGHEAHVRALERPARVREPAGEQKADAERARREGHAGDQPPTARAALGSGRRAGVDGWPESLISPLHRRCGART